MYNIAMTSAFIWHSNLTSSASPGPLARYFFGFYLEFYVDFYVDVYVEFYVDQNPFFNLSTKENTI